MIGDVLRGAAIRTLYATDASEYREMPRAVAFPQSESDIAELIALARAEKTSLIPRAAGTSLAGQVVGGGIVVDVGRQLNQILAIDPARRRVRVQPGVVRNQLNAALRPHGLFFAPETSTANRAMIGGMFGNNSCGANSIVYGSTRDHVVAVRGFLSDGSCVEVGPLDASAWRAKCEGPEGLETRIYRLFRAILGDPRRREAIRTGFPKPEVTRRNTGYALDALIDCAPFAAQSQRPFNLCRLLAGSEGTLFLATELELNCEPLPAPGALLCAHFETVDQALRATQIAMRHRPQGCELIDRHILECTKANHEQARNRFFVQGDPAAVLIVEVAAADPAAARRQLEEIAAEMRAAGLGYAYPLAYDADVTRVWDLRRAGQGIVNHLRGEAQPREIVEDTAVAVADLPEYVRELDALLREKYATDAIYYGHAGAGELHVRPLFNLKTPEGLVRFRAIATDVAALVKRYRGSLSGEHGDGRLRGEFIRGMVGEECYQLMRLVKETFDPEGIFNPGKIIDPPPMDTFLRHGPADPDPKYETWFDFSAQGGVLRAAEKCTGVGECRKLPASGGTMCPSYMATREEKDTTRARANMLREVLMRPRDPQRAWDSTELAEVMDLCVSCKACRSECPSNVDMARLKAEWLQHEHDLRGVPRRDRVVAGFARAMRVAAVAPGIYNWAVGQAWIAGAVKTWCGFAEERSLPRLPARSVRAEWKRRRRRTAERDGGAVRRVNLFLDEFTDCLDAEVGIAVIEVLEGLGYEVVIPSQVDSGRAQISKGLLREGRALAEANIERLDPVVTEDAPLVGIEPSALLGFRDEFPDLVRAEFKAGARRLAGRAFLFEEFIAREAQAGRISAQQFDGEVRRILVHGHCHQKALGSVDSTVEALRVPQGHSVEAIPSGCCGMAGSFGMEAEHYAVSQQIGELVLFPAVRAAEEATLIAAPGTSCRHQVLDGTRRKALHPAQILRMALRPGPAGPDAR